MIANAVGEKVSIVAILDDTAETVEDLLWMQDLLIKYPKLNICLLVNTAQISINFSSQMLSDVLNSPNFSELAGRMGNQFNYLEIYSPFISFQTNFLQESARTAISGANIVYVKGANFFETCQIPDKDTFYGFIVFGPISRLYTGLQDFDAVFAYVPKGQTGYLNHRDKAKIRTLKDVCTSRRQSSGGHNECI
ncbi:MAG: hypothetical protein EHJ95_07875 [Methanobacteriota archaeon]|nr:MAG: hypothetical protein EHJ95_07875 [Euryarchaeota archaeon]